VSRKSTIDVEGVAQAMRQAFNLRHQLTSAEVYPKRWWRQKDATLLRTFTNRRQQANNLRLAKQQRTMQPTLHNFEKGLKSLLFN
jgi:hypothetical protein